MRPAKKRPRGTGAFLMCFVSGGNGLGAEVDGEFRQDLLAFVHGSQLLFPFSAC